MTAASRSSDWLRVGLPIGSARGETQIDREQCVPHRYRLDPPLGNFDVGASIALNWQWDLCHHLPRPLVAVKPASSPSMWTIKHATQSDRYLWKSPKVIPCNRLIATLHNLHYGYN
jgi:hypothetical protein